MQLFLKRNSVNICRWNARPTAYFSIHTEEHKLFISQYKSLDYAQRVSLIHDVLVPIFSSNLHKIIEQKHHYDRSNVKTGDIVDAKSLLFSLTQFNVLTIRADLKQLLKAYRYSTHDSWYKDIAPRSNPPESLVREMDEYFKNWLRIAYNHDNLLVKQLTTTTDDILHTIMATERIHIPIDIADLRSRITSDSNRRTYGLFHQAAPNQLLSYLHVGFTSKLATSMR